MINYFGVREGKELPVAVKTLRVQVSAISNRPHVIEEWVYRAYGQAEIEAMKQKLEKDLLGFAVNEATEIQLHLTQPNRESIPRFAIAITREEVVYARPGLTARWINNKIDKYLDVK